MGLFLYFRGGAGAAAGGRAAPAGWVGGGLGEGGGERAEGEAGRNANRCLSLCLGSPEPLAAQPRQARGQRAGSPRSPRPSGGWQEEDEERREGLRVAERHLEEGEWRGTGDRRGEQGGDEVGRDGGAREGRERKGRLEK